ncbi:MAG: energy-coupling factor ABC transporter substrate-binding protein [bacterium]
MKTALMILAIVALAILPLALHQPDAGSEAFGGADDKAKAIVENLSPTYKPWVQPLWNPPSGEIATLLFSLQAALGAGVIGYYLGYLKGRRKKD